jgi:hypothetical protein
MPAAARGEITEPRRGVAGLERAIAKLEEAPHRLAADYDRSPPETLEDLIAFVLDDGHTALPS